MKNLILFLFVMTATVFTSEIQAQKTCTPAQMEACKKSCTPEQIAACKKICDGKAAASTSTASAVKVVNKAPDAKKTNCQKVCSKTKTASTSTSSEGAAKLVALKADEKKAEKKSCCAISSCILKKE